MPSITRWIPNALLGAGLGWWLFGPPGLVLYAGLGLLVALLAHRAAARFGRRACVLPLLLAAVFLFRASTLGWGGGEAPDGTRFKASPIGLSHVLAPHRYPSPTVDCAWYGARVQSAPCQVGRRTAWNLLRTVYPLVLSATMFLLTGAVLTALARDPHWLTRAVTGLSALLAILALLVFNVALPTALAALDGVSVGTGGTLGVTQVTVAILLAFACAMSPGARGGNRE